MKRDYVNDKVQETVNVEHYLSLVKKVVNQLNIKESSVIDQDDLISMGVTGLLDAVRKFDGTKNASFETYARLRIRGAIIDELRRLGILSRGHIGQVKLYHQKRAELTQQLLMEPTDQQLCEYMGISQKELANIYLNLHYLSTTSLDKTLYHSDEQEIFLMDQLEDPEDNVLVNLEKRDQSQELVAAIESLDQREQCILQFYYVEELSLNQMSEILGVSVSRISQLHGKAIASLRQKLAVKKVD